MFLRSLTPRLCVSSERSHAHGRRPGQAADEGALQPVRRSGGRLRICSRREDHHLHWPAGLLGHGLFPGEWSKADRLRLKVAHRGQGFILSLLYWQVEDVNRKFEALGDAESRGWVEERKPPPRQKKVVKVSKFSFYYFKTLSCCASRSCLKWWWWTRPRGNAHCINTVLCSYSVQHLLDRKHYCRQQNPLTNGLSDMLYTQ